MSSFKINKLNKRPYYLQLKESIESAILSGALLDGTHLPTESEMCKVYDLSRTVVRQSYKLLSQEKLIKTVQGQGSFVTSRPVLFIEINDFFNLKSDGLNQQTLLVDVYIKELNSKIYRHKSIINNYAYPAVYQIAYLSPLYFKQLEIKIQNEFPIDIITDKYGQDIKFHSVATTALANEELAYLLKINVKDPINVIKTYAIINNKDKVAYFESYLPGKFVEINVLYE